MRYMGSILNDELKTAAQHRRNRGRGGSTVTVYSTTEAMYRARGITSDTRTEGSKIADSVRDLWRSMKDDALWSFRAEIEQDDPADLFIPF